jgi:hypothetical protein
MGGQITYNGVTADLVSDDEGWIPDWERESYTNAEHYPESDYDEVQYGGLGDRVVTWTVRVNTEADAAALEGSVGENPRTLTVGYTDFDDTTESDVYAGVRLDRARRRRKTVMGANSGTLAAARWYELELTFRLEGATVT